MADLVKPGRYIAKVVEYGIPEPKPGKHPQAALVFEFEVAPGQKQRLTYFGSFHPNAAEYTMKALITAGFKYNDLAALLSPNAFWDKEVSITVEHQQYEGKTRAKITWVNEAGGANFKNLTPQEAKTQLGPLNTYLGALRKEMGAEAPPAAGPTGSDSDFDPSPEDFDIGA